MNGINLYKFGKASVRVADRNGEPWFIAADVCRVLGIENPRQAAAQLDDDERSTVCFNDGGQPRKFNIISESGLYALIVRSNKPEARKFRKWVTSEVLPAIRKNGAYVSPDITDGQMKTLLDTIAQLQYENAMRKFQHEVDEKRIAALAKYAPSAEFGDKSRITGNPRDIIVSMYLRSDKRPHKPHMTQWVQLRLNLELPDNMTTKERFDHAD